MSHNTLINGTSYEITGGRTLVDGTGYSISGGRTLVDGTGYDISFSNLPPVGMALNDYTWEEIRAISDAGVAASYFNIGDRKEVTLNGTVGRVSFSNNTYCCYIIGIDHNSAKEGANLIHFQFGYSALSGGVQIAFVDNAYDSWDQHSNAFSWTGSENKSCGWSASRMRTSICSAFKNVVPSKLKAVLKNVSKYTDNTGDGSNTASYVTRTKDTIFLLAEYEVFGKITVANTAEQKHQAQYAYYSAGNSKVRYKHNNVSSSAKWYLRSPRAAFNNEECSVSASGLVSAEFKNYSLGFAPAFCV